VFDDAKHLGQERGGTVKVFYNEKKKNKKGHKTKVRWGKSAKIQENESLGKGTRINLILITASSDQNGGVQR